MNKIKEYYYEIKTPKIGNTRIVLLADVHYFEKREKYKLDIVYERVKKINPDYIVIAGDLIDKAFVKNIDILYNWLCELSKICKIFISMGNHELKGDNEQEDFDKDFFEKISEISNVVVLDNQSVILNNMNIMGLTMNLDYFCKDKENSDLLIEKVNLLFNDAKEDMFNILLCHSPLKISKKQVLDKIKIGNNLDLILCGHTHGGITPEFLKPLLKGIGLISPLKQIFFKNAYGKSKIGNTDVIVTSGVTKASHNNKFHFLDNCFTREITVIDIKNKK